MIRIASASGVSPAIGLDTDDHLRRIVHVLGDELVEPAGPLEPIRQASAREACAVAVHQMDVVMVLSPVIAHEDLHSDSLRSVASFEPENTRRREAPRVA